jgi:hypothetical protein
MFDIAWSSIGVVPLGSHSFSASDECVLCQADWQHALWTEVGSIGRQR